MRGQNIQRYLMRLQGSPRSAKILGPIQMKSLEKAAGECLKQAEIAEESFEQVLCGIEQNFKILVGLCCVIHRLPFVLN